MSADTSIPTHAAAPIRIEGDPVLREPSAPVGRLDDEFRRQAVVLQATLADFRRTHGFGRAIAAPQIGIARRLLALDLGAGPFLLINPEISWRSAETFEVWDDCFSVPDRLVRVRRHLSISVSYRDADFRLRRWEKLSPDLSELLQHEIDHLDGVLMTDRAVDADSIRPAAERERLIDMARGGSRLSLALIADAASRIDPVFRNTPQFECEPLSALLGCRLTLKIETLNPIRSFKGRGADYFVQRLIERGGAPSVVCASAGNFGQAMAYACRKHGLALMVFAARNANALKIERMRALGADVRLDADDYDAAKRAARRHAQETGALMVEDGLLPEISEGAGTTAVELLAGGMGFDAVLIPLGDGALINGMARWIKARTPHTRIIGVCARGAPAFAESWRNPADLPPVVHDRSDTIADGIAVTAPIAESVQDARALVDRMLLVDEPDIIAAMRLLHLHAGLMVEPAAAVGVAALLAQRADFANLNVATVITGSNLTAQQIQQWLTPNHPEHAP